jgi:uncharacterized membrane protein YkvA (DUF1232 family)/transposase-like protein
MVWLLGPRVLPLAGAGIPSAVAPVVIGGCGSSGTTLLRRMLDRHPEIFCGPEATVFLKRMSSIRDIAERFGFEPGQVEAWRRESCTRVEFIERFQAACLTRSGKRIWAEKTPENIRAFPQIAARFPRARLIHVIRDGRDVACSLRQAAWAPLEKITGGAPRSSPEALDASIRYWAERVRFGREMRGCPRYFEVRYEELVAEPRETMARLLAFLGAEFDEQVLQPAAAPAARDDGPVVASQVGRWRREFGQAEAEIVERQAGGLLRELDYADGAGWAEGLPEVGAPPPAKSDLRPGRPRRSLQRRLVAFGLAATDARSPLALRCLPLCAAAYVVAPRDLIPDSLGPIGWSDDLAVVALSLAGMAALPPARLKAGRRHEAALVVSRDVWAVPPLKRRSPLRAVGARLRRRWSQLLSGAAGHAYLVDRELRIVSASPSAYRSWGKAPQEVLGRPLAEIFPAVVSGEGYKALVRAVRTSRPVRIRTTSVLFGRRMDLRARPVSDGARVRVRLAA